ncbi:MAG: M13 family metallopeptidase [Erysipelotrichaceae bacterium]|nr:M13 family metallopeptidase [Erysipelotrichaceae bacterium]
MKVKCAPYTKGRTARKALCLILTLPLMAATAGCAAKSEIESYFVHRNQTISPDSPWYPSFIHQGIDSSLQVSEKDDYFTCVNKTWLLNTRITEQNPIQGKYSDGDRRIQQKIESIVRGQKEDSSGTHPAGLSEEQTEHDRDLVVKMASLAGNWDQRNRLGAEPLRPYIEEIEKIGSLQDLDHYLTSRDAKKIGPFSLTGIYAAPTSMDKTTNQVIICPPNSTLDAALCKTTLGAYSNYINMTRDDLKAASKAREAMSSVLSRLGYSDDEIEKLCSQAFDLESNLAEIYMNAQDASITNLQDMEKAAENSVALSELKELQGRYPLAEFLKGYGLDGIEQYNVVCPEAVRMIGRLYNPDNLEKLKSYLILQTVSQSVSLLDRSLYDMTAVLDDKTNHEKPVNHTHWDDETKILIKDFIYKYLNDPLSQVFIWQNCTEENKAMVHDLAEEIMDEYKVMLAGEDWLSEQTRQNACEKLENVTVRSLYPDVFSDYTSLSLDQAENVVDAAAAIQTFHLISEGKKAGKPFDWAEWPNDGMPTYEINAFYAAEDNSINILEGFLESSWSPDQSREEILAGLGTAIGHEISHGFDTFGSNYDKDGKPESWWTEGDRKAFEERADRLAGYFNTLPALPSGETCNGQQVKNEVIADLGGLRCALNLARQSEDFDYVKFFESYAELWKSKGSYAMIARYLTDPHPLDYLRVNAEVQQLQEFYDTYNIKENDGMYLAPEKRIAVW